MYLVKTLVGLILVFVPYTVAYAAGFLCVAFRENYYDLIWYLPGYFGGILFGLSLYGIAAFSFARANRVADGVIFMIFYALIGLLIASLVEEIEIERGIPYDERMETVYFSPMGCFIVFSEKIDALLREGGNQDLDFLMFLFVFLHAIAGFALLFLLPRFDKGEDAEQYSDTWFGYRVMIPLYTALLIGLMGGTEALYIVLFTVAAIVMTIIYRRKALFSWQYWVMIAVGALGGIVLNLIIF